MRPVLPVICAGMCPSCAPHVRLVRRVFLQTSRVHGHVPSFFSICAGRFSLTHPMTHVVAGRVLHTMSDMCGPLFAYAIAEALRCTVHCALNVWHVRLVLPKSAAKVAGTCRRCHVLVHVPTPRAWPKRQPLVVDNAGQPPQLFLDQGRLHPGPCKGKGKGRAPAVRRFPDRTPWPTHASKHLQISALDPPSLFHIAFLFCRRVLLDPQAYLLFNVSASSSLRYSLCRTKPSRAVGFETSF